jgi:hypothetical protein
MSVNFAYKYLFDDAGHLTCLKSYDMGPTDLLPLQRKLCYWLLSPLKIHRTRPGLKSRTLGLIASIITSRPQRANYWLPSLLTNDTSDSRARSLNTANAKSFQHFPSWELVFLESFVLYCNFLSYPSNRCPTGFSIKIMCACLIYIGALYPSQSLHPEWQVTCLITKISLHNILH